MDNFFRRVPVTSKGKVIGIVSRRDVLDYMFKADHDRISNDEAPDLASTNAAGK
jgi:CBS domain-containing protein